MTLEEIERYGRQVVLPGWGGAGQERLAAATVRVLGRGPSARAAALYLAGAGVGRLVVEAFADDARALNPLCAIEPTAGEGPGPARVTAGGFAVRADEDSTAAGAFCAVETLKALLGLPGAEGR
jgi:hypothetical protein